MASGKSGLTRAQHNVAAALMGQAYDWRDHTYFHPGDIDAPILDADTCEPLLNWGLIPQRKLQVKAEEIGCEDGPFTLTPA